MKQYGMRAAAAVLALLLCLALAACGGEVENDPEAANYEVTDGVITKYTGPGGDVTIPAEISGKEITAIGEKAFYANKTITGVVISNGIREIGASAFESCSEMRSVDLGRVEKVGAGAFAACRLLSLTIPETVTEIGAESFRSQQRDNMDEMTGTLVIPASLKTLPDRAFSFARFGSVQFKSATLPEMSANTFENYGTAVKIVLPNSVTPEQVPEYREKLVAAGMTDSEALVTFWNTKGEELVMVYEDYSQVFRYNDEAGWIIQYIGDAENVVVPAEINGCPITAINQDAFSGNEKIRSVTISQGITEIGSYAFSNCVNLESVSIRDGMLTIGNRAFEGCSQLTTVILPDSVTSLGEYVFYECRALKDVTLSAGLTELPDYAFNECSALERIMLPSGVRTLGDGVFQNCTSLSSVNLDHLTSLGRNCFQKTAFTEITIPGSVKEIPEYCFWLCPYLVDITLEEGVERIGNDAFSQCGNDESKKIGEHMYFGTPTEDFIIYENQEEYRPFINIRLPGSLQTVGSYFVEGCRIDGIYMLDVRSVADMPDFDPNAFQGLTVIGQVYFEKDVIEAHGAELDQFLMSMENMNDIAWYDEGYHWRWCSKKGA